ncbi:hypothetical protein [Pengzhenrongella sicca]|uniref:Uncharacterized protein n=1 Tax=Pengzhenrongella sicca TaxID=2819238 RepID=A0A8A4ZCE3_9MICO|nr:hypothetical protein [Pengzhenrongella sicca]QTE28543.1 hypothetical protein J4E96_14370 [Pengzhenrongella sicca]
MKISLHKDGNFQHGPTPEVRATLRPGDRHALDRWSGAPEIGKRVRLALILRFREAELRPAADNLDPRCTRLPSPPVGSLLGLAVLLSDAPGVDEPPIPGWTVAVRLPRGGPGEALLAWSHIAEEPGARESALEQMASLGAQWKWSARGSAEPFGWSHGETEDGLRTVSEWALDSLVDLGDQNLAYLRTRLPDVRPLTAYQRELPLHVELCAVLEVGGIGKPVLYVDDRARCNHEALLEDVLTVLSALNENGPDGGWDELEDGTLTTGIAVQHD